MRRRSPGSPTHAPNYTPRVHRVEGRVRRAVSLDDHIGLLSRTYRDPVLVASTDGVGTKLKVAFATGRHSTVGIDLVAMSVNDCLCAGAEPLLFLDYVAMNRDDPELTSAIVQGVSDGCIEAECALLGGETAILPDSTRRANTTWRASASASSSGGTSSTAATSVPATRSSGWRARGSTPTASAWCARSSSTTPVSP